MHQSIDGNAKGHPMQRAMFLEYLSDRTTHHLDRQYMLGPALLVAPVFVPEGEASEYYLPAGRWTAFFQPARTLAGPAWVREVVPIDQIPVWVRQGSVLCLGPAEVGRPDYDYAGAGLEVQVYEFEEGQTAKTAVPSGKGNETAGVVEAKVQDGELVVSVASGSVDLASVSYFAGGQVKKAEATGQGVISLKV